MIATIMLAVALMQTKEASKLPTTMVADNLLALDYRANVIVSPEKHKIEITNDGCEKGFGFVMRPNKPTAWYIFHPMIYFDKYGTIHLNGVTLVCELLTE